jgi:hypothetical protein
LFTDELLRLREQLLQRNRLGDAYHPDDIDGFNPQAWLKELLGDDANPDDSLDTIRQKVNAALAKMNKAFEAEKKRLEDRLRVCLSVRDHLNAPLTFLLLPIF